MIFRRRKHDVSQSQIRLDDADARAIAAEAQNQAARRLAEQSRTVTERLLLEVEKNHWTELLQRAWGAR